MWGGHNEVGKGTKKVSWNCWFSKDCYSEKIGYWPEWWRSIWLYTNISLIQEESQEINEVIWSQRKATQVLQNKEYW